MPPKAKEFEIATRTSFRIDRFVPAKRDLQGAFHFRARAVAEGKYKNAADAAAACITPLAELRRRLEGPRPCAPVRRSQTSIYGRMRAQARALGARAAWSHSSPAERKVVLQWVERYWRTRDVKPTWYIIDLADLMRTELEHKGFRRDTGFCERALARRIRLSRREHATGT